MVLVQQRRESNGEECGAFGKNTQEGGASSARTKLEKEPARKSGVWGTQAEQGRWERGHLKVAATRNYSKWIRTISGAVQTRRGGPQVPAPLEV
jgi:hypothetical protein